MPSDAFVTEHFNLSPQGGFHFRGSRYSHAQLPAADDPGWTDFARPSDGARHRLIRVHGPFLLDTPDGELECHDGWLGQDEKGDVFVVEAADHNKLYKEG